MYSMIDSINLVIVTYRNREGLARLLDQLHVCEQPCEINVFVANNSPEVRVDDICLSHDADLFEYQNLGYGKAFNATIDKIGLTDTSLYCVLNDDLEIIDNSIFTRVFQGYERITGEGIKLGTLSVRYRCNLSENAKTYVEYNQMIGESYQGVDFAPAAFWVLNAQFLRDSNGFHPAFFMYVEDKELSIRSSRLGFKHFELTNTEIGHCFNYPPLSFRLRVIMDSGEFIKSYLLDDSLLKTLWIFIYGFSARFLRLKLLQASSYVLGFGLFLLRIRSIQLVI